LRKCAPTPQNLNVLRQVNFDSTVYRQIFSALSSVMCRQVCRLSHPRPIGGSPFECHADDVDLLVLGGTRFVGRAVVEVALARGWAVTTVTRGISGRSNPEAETLRADRTDPAALSAVLGARSWDAVVDTWSGAPRTVHDAAARLVDHVGHYGYVSSRSVYCWPIPEQLDEHGPVVAGDPASPDDGDYAAAKRGGELAVLEAFGDRALVARAGLILGPYESVGRLPWWLRRLERGGRVLAPGPKDRPLQFIDARDLAEWMLSAADEGVGGIFNTVSRPGHATIGELLDACRAATGSGAQLVWTSPELIARAGIAAWTELPIWLPPTGETAGLHSGDVSAAMSHGLHCRPVADTVADTWRWLQAEGDPPSLSDRSVGLDATREAQVLAEIS
jgi:nucleoside-diphosphate-sugar epimerase